MKPEDFGHGLHVITTFGTLADGFDGMCQCGDWQETGPEWLVRANHTAHAALFDPERGKSQAAAVQERRRSGAAGKHRDRRTRRIRERAAARRKAIEDASNPPADG